MKAVLFTISLFFCLITLSFSQAPQAINYQGVARDVNGVELSNTTISLRLSIHEGSTSGTIVYSEVHTLSTNEFGLFAIEIGKGSTSDDFSAIDWSTGAMFLQVEMDDAGGVNFVDMGTSELVSVPYALYAENSGSSIWVKNPKGATLFNTTNTDKEAIINSTIRDLEIISDDADGSTSLRFRDVASTEYSYSMAVTNSVSSLGPNKFVFYHESGPGLAADKAKMAIDSNGYVGIGTAFPDSRLTIEAQANTGQNKNFITIRNTSNGIGSYANMVIRAGGNDHFGTLSHHSENYNLLLGYQRKTMLSNQGNGLVLRSLDEGQIEFITGTDLNDMSTKMLINKQGNVGIGTATPTNSLTIIGNKGGDERTFVYLHNELDDVFSTVSMKFIAGSDDSYFGSISQAGINYGLTDQSGKTILSNTGNGLMLRSVGAEQIEFVTGIDGTPAALSTKMILNNEGNLGIGTENPQYKLTIEDSTVGVVDERRFVFIHNKSEGLASSVGLSLLAGPDNGSISTFTHFSETYEGVPGYALKTSVTNLGNGLMLRSFGAGIIEFKTGLDYDPTGNNTKMLIDIDGNVGIGETSNLENLLSIKANKSSVVEKRFLLLHNTSTDIGSYVTEMLKAGNGDSFGTLTHNSDTYILAPGLAEKTVLTNSGQGLVFRSAGVGNIEFATGPVISPTGVDVKMVFDVNGNLGIGDLTPSARLTVADGDVYVTDDANGIILTSPNGSCYRITVDDAGNLTTTLIPCP